MGGWKKGSITLKMILDGSGTGILRGRDFAVLVHVYLQLQKKKECNSRKLRYIQQAGDDSGRIWHKCKGTLGN